jgi:hypothetical protein
MDETAQHYTQPVTGKPDPDNGVFLRISLSGIHLRIRVPVLRFSQYGPWDNPGDQQWRRGLVWAAERDWQRSFRR